eukprot:1966938-Prymnesium_polylepis.1
MASAKMRLALCQLSCAPMPSGICACWLSDDRMNPERATGCGVRISEVQARTAGSARPSAGPHLIALSCTVGSGAAVRTEACPVSLSAPAGGSCCFAPHRPRAARAGARAASTRARVSGSEGTQHGAELNCRASSSELHSTTPVSMKGRSFHTPSTTQLPHASQVWRDACGLWRRGRPYNP